MTSYQPSAPRPIPTPYGSTNQSTASAAPNYPSKASLDSYPAAAPQQRVADIRQNAGVPQYPPPPSQVFGTAPQPAYGSSPSQQPQQQQYGTSPSYTPQMQQHLYGSSPQQQQYGTSPQPQQQYGTSPQPQQQYGASPQPQQQYGSSPQQAAGFSAPAPQRTSNTNLRPAYGSTPPSSYAPPPQLNRPRGYSHGSNQSWSSQQGRPHSNSASYAPQYNEPAPPSARRHSEAPQSSVHRSHAHRTDYERRSESPTYSDGYDSAYDSDYHEDGCKRYGREHREHKREHHGKSRRHSKSKSTSDDKRPTLTESTIWAWDKFTDVLKGRA